MNGRINGINGHEPKVKVEDKLDEGQLNRLAAGVPVDAARETGVRIHLYLRIYQHLMHI